MTGAGQGADPRDAEVGSFGLMILLVALAVLFAATVIVTWYFRDEAAEWGTAVPALPLGLLVATGLLGVLSALVEAAARAAEGASDAAGAAPAGAGLRRAHALLTAGGVCAVLFLIVQVWNWKALVAGRPADLRPSFYEFNFFLLTLLHAVHVVGGLAFHVIVWGRARRALAPARVAGTLRRNAVYWHFLAGAWAVILANLALTRIADPAASWLGPASVAALVAATIVCVGYQVVVAGEFFKRGRVGLGLGSLLPPFALLAFWAHAGDWGQQRRLARWTLAFLLWLCFAMLAAAIHSERLFGG